MQNNTMSVIGESPAEALCPRFEVQALPETEDQQRHTVQVTDHLEGTQYECCAADYGLSDEHVLPDNFPLVLHAYGATRIEAMTRWGVGIRALTGGMGNAA